LPNLLVFEEDLQGRRDAENHLLIAIAWHGLGHDDHARRHLARTLAFSNSDPWAIQLSNALGEKLAERAAEDADLVPG
jgi:hypothetical protein